VVAEARADPGHAGAARLLDRDVDRSRDDEVAHAVVAVDDSHRRPFVHDADVRMLVDSARAQPLQVRCQADDAMAIAALQVGLGHERGHLRRIGLRQALVDEGGLDEIAQRLVSHAWAVSALRDHANLTGS